jgi:glycosyltransferase involved in cell wall biosynthesis
VLCPIGDVVALAKAMDDILDRPDEARAMGQRGRRRMVETFDLAPVIRQHEMLYRDLLAERIARM